MFRKVLIYIELMRPRQWIKNLFVVAPLIFSNSFLDLVKIGLSLEAFFIFSSAAGGLYIFNDVKDLNRDKNHPLKKSRPLARGGIGQKEALTFSGVLILLSLFWGWLISLSFFTILISYMLLNVFYTLYLKHVVLLDMFSVAIGFVLRVLAGIAVIQVMASPWILGAAFFIALFIIASKRYMEIVLAQSTGLSRPVLGYYNREFLREVVFASLILTITVYILYSFLEVKNIIFIITILPVVYGMFRFLWLVEGGRINTDNPTDILYQDRPLEFAILVFLVTVVSIFLKIG